MAVPSSWDRPLTRIGKPGSLLPTATLWVLVCDAKQHLFISGYELHVNHKIASTAIVGDEMHVDKKLGVFLGPLQRVCRVQYGHLIQQFHIFVIFVLFRNVVGVREGRSHGWHGRVAGP
jgi:hypothetical protein